MRALLFATLLALAAGPVTAAPLALPVRYPGERIAGPCYAGDVLEVQLAPRAARAAHPFGAGPTRRGLVGALGVASVDATAATMGATFEPEFAGERAPDPFAAGATDFTGFQIVHLPQGTRLESALAAFRALPDVASAWPIAILPTSSFPNDSLFSAEHWLYRASVPRHDMRAPESWDVERGDTSVVVAILDTGVQPYHPDLGGVTAGGHGNLWINWAEAGGVPGMDDDGNGWVDDVWGWDFVASSAGDSLTSTPGEDVLDQDNDPNDFAGHGTMMAGIVGAIANNASGIAGVVPNVRIMPVRMGWMGRGGTRPNGFVRMDFAAQAVRYATLNGATVMNCSWSSDYLAGLDAALTAATRAGIAIVNASGNFGSPAYLGSREDVISVAATDSTDQYWPGSVTGPWLDLAADGVNMTSTCVVGTAGDSIAVRQPGYVSGLDGTSFAAPQVAGAVALLQAQAGQRSRPRLTPLGLRLRLVETADDVSATNPSISYPAPRLNLLRALTDPPTSTAVRGGAAGVGPPLVLRYSDGRTRVVLATSDRHLVAYDGATADTAWIAPLAATPVGSVAGAELGVGLGVGIFVGGASGQVFGFRDDGTALPGWPRTGLGNVQMYGGATLGDLDGDGVLEVVVMASNGRVGAWHADGTMLEGFPFATGTLGANAPTLANVDGQPGQEILVLDGVGVLHAIDHTGAEVWQWAAPPGAGTPVAARLGHAGAPLGILVSDPTGVTALDTTGTPIWNAPLAVNTASDPAFTDVDGDGVDELVLSAGTPTTIARLDSAGVVVAAHGWPFVPAIDPLGPLVTGPLRAGHGPCTGFFTSVGFVAFDDGGQVVPAFPKPVATAGVAPTLADLRGDGATQVVAGTAADSNVCVFDAGPGTWDARLAIWPTPRGNGARTGSRVYAAGPVVFDRTPPAAVRDLAGVATSTSSIRLAWTATGDDSVTGRAARVELRRAGAPITDATFGAATLVPTGTPGTAGVRDTALGSGLPEGTTWWFALRAWDAEGNASGLSNAVPVATSLVPPGPVADLRVTAIADTVVTLAWTACGDNGAAGRPANYEIAADTAPVDSAHFDAARVHVVHAATVDAGGTEAAGVPGLSRGRHWYFALRAVDAAGARSRLSNVAGALVPVGGALSGRSGPAVAARSCPSRVTAVLDWQGVDDGGASAQSLTLFDMNGRILRRVPLGPEPGGTWNWDGRDGESRLLPAGLYLVRLTSGGRHANARVVLLR